MSARDGAGGPDPPRPPGPRWAGPAVLAGLLGAVLFSLELQGPPDPLPADAPDGRFSAARAVEHVGALAAGPRSVGTPASARARDYLLAELRSLGLEPEVQERRLLWRRGRMVGTATVRNVAARVEGEASTGAVALVAHYDSRWRTPGAADDASGVAAILEALRALGPELPLRNDLVVLFTDGEEAGLLGARAFTGSHRWMGDVAAVVNLEASGNSGPSLMFETGRRPGWAVERLARAEVRPVTSSLFDDVYRRLPNDTDFTLFRRAGREGLNFAFVGGSRVYHMPLDTPDRLSLASLQHHGEAALSLAREMGGADLSAPGGGGGRGGGGPGGAGPGPGRGEADAAAGPGAAGTSPVFFSLPVIGLVRYPHWAALLLAAALAVGTIVLVGRGRGSRHVTGGGIVAGLVAAPLLVAAGAGAAWLLREAALHVHPEEGWFVGRRLYREGGYLVASVAAAGGLVLGGLGLLRRWFTAPSLALGAVIWPVFFAAGASLEAVAGSYLLAWPAASALALTALELRRRPAGAAGARREGRRAEGRGPPGGPGAAPGSGGRDGDGRLAAWGRAGAAVAISLPVAALAAPALREFAAVLGVGVLPELTAAAGLFLLCLAPVADLLGRPNRWWAPALGLAVAAAVAGAELARAAAGPAGPAPAPLLHVQEGEDGPTFWATARDTGVGWLDRFVGVSFAELGAEGAGGGPARLLELGSSLYGPGEPRRYRASPAPAAGARPAELEVMGRGAAGDTATLRLRLRVPGRERLPGPVLAAEVAPAGESPWRLASVDGRELPGGRGDGESWIYRHLGRPEGTIVLELRRAAGRPPGPDTPPPLATVLYLEGLPELPGAPSTERPPDLMGSPFVGGRRVLTDLTVVRDTVRP